MKRVLPPLLAVMLAGCGQSLVDFFVGGAPPDDNQPLPDLSTIVEDLSVPEDLAGGDLGGVDFAEVDGANLGDGGNVDMAFPPGTDLFGIDFASPPTCTAVHFSADATQTVQAADNNVHDPGGSFTVEAWVYVTALNNHEQVVIAHWNPSNMGGAANKRQWRLYLDGTGHAVFGVNYAVIGERTATSAGTVPLNQWAHMSGVYQQQTVTSVLHASVNGAVTSSSSIASILIQNSDSGLSIGNYPAGNGGGLVGYLSYARVQNGALYLANFTPANTYEADVGTIALYKFLDGTGLSATDSSPNAVTATLQNGAAYAMPPMCR